MLHAPTLNLPGSFIGEDLFRTPMLKAPPIHQQTDSQQAHSGLNWWVFLWASVVFIVYGSLFPFNFQSEAKPIAEFYAEWHMLRSIPDASDNFLLFIPLGVGLDACFRGRNRLFLASLVAWLILGVGIQLIQLYLPTRTAAVSDALWNALGMTCGVLAFARVRLTIDHLRRRSAGQQDNFAMVLVAVWFCYESYPFVPTLDIGELRDHIKSVVIAPPFEMMRLLQHFLAAVLAGMFMLRANWLQTRWLNVLIPGIFAVFLEVFVAYGSLRRETLMGFIGGLLLAYWLTANKPQRTPVLAAVTALCALMVTVLIPFRGQVRGSTFTFTPFADIFWKGVTIDVSPSAFEALAIGALLWIGVQRRRVTPISRAAWISAVFALLLVLEVFRVYVVGYRGDTTPLVMAVILASFIVSFGKEKSKIEPITDSYLHLAAHTKRWMIAPNIANVVAVAAFATLLAVVLHLPGLPYSLRALFPPGVNGVMSAVALVITAYGMANVMFLLLDTAQRKWFLLFPALVVLHGMVTWWLLRYSVPTKSLFDIVGAPVLGWLWDWEPLGRYVALHMAIMLQLVGAVLCVRAILWPRTLADVLYWVVISGVMSWPLYLVVLQWAATDNLTELIASDASFWAASALATALFLTCFVASALAAALAGAQRAKTLASLAVLASIGAAVLYRAGTEQTIVKYGTVFSAFQFLLSTDRAHYAQGIDLILRFAIAFFATSCALALLQWASWRRLCTISSRE